MRVVYTRRLGVKIEFGPDKLVQALSVLRALAQYFGASFIQNVADDLQNDLFPKPKLSYTRYHHICIKCACEVDSRNSDTVEVAGEWFHKICPKLKDNRPE